MNQGLSSDIEWTSKIILKEEFIGSGSFGLLYKVIHTDTKDVAVLRESKKNKRNLERQIWKLASSYPYVTQLYASFTEGSRLIYVFEYLPMGDLRSFIGIHKVLPMECAKILTAQISLAIDYLHGKKIFHRDISNKNILMSSSGIAKLSNFQYSVMKRNSLGLYGHVFYQAPEVFSGCKYDFTADWFSLGICLYEMIMSMTPVEHHCMRHGIEFQKLDHLGKRVVLLTSSCYIPKVFPDKLKSVLEKMLDKNVKKRLGYKNEIEAIKTHPFFGNLEWSNLEKGELSADLSSLEKRLWWEKKS